MHPNSISGERLLSLLIHQDFDVAVQGKHDAAIATLLRALTYHTCSSNAYSTAISYPGWSLQRNQRSNVLLAEPEYLLQR